MHAAEIIVREVQSTSRFQVRQPLRESVRQARKSPHLHPHGQVLPLDVRGADAVGVTIRCSSALSPPSPRLPESIVPGQTEPCRGPPCKPLEIEHSNKLRQGELRWLLLISNLGPASPGYRRARKTASCRCLNVTNLSARFRQLDRNGGLGLGGRKNADGRARQSKRRWKELEFRLS